MPQLHLAFEHYPCYLYWKCANWFFKKYCQQCCFLLQRILFLISRIKILSLYRRLLFSINRDYSNLKHLSVTQLFLLEMTLFFDRKNITQDRKRFITQSKLSESWWSAFVISTKKIFFSSWAWPTMTSFLCKLGPKNNF